MLPKKFRFPVQETRHSRAERTIPGKFFSIRVYDGQEVNRFGVVISAKVDKRSVRRHFWKRRIMDAVARWPNFKKDFVIVVSPHLRVASTDDLARALEIAVATIIKIYA